MTGMNSKMPAGCWSYSYTPLVCQVLACWQLLEGAEPAKLRRQLADALPDAPPARVQAVRCKPA